MTRNLIFVILILQLMACAEQVDQDIAKPLLEVVKPLEVPPNNIDKSKLHYNKNGSLWILDNKPFSGYAVGYFPDSTLMLKIGIVDGKKQNETTEWYPDGHLKYSTNYHQGKLHGEKKSWSPDSTHLLISHLNYHLSKAHGVQKKWYPSGELFKILHLNKGKEEGIQQAFRKNGNLYVNYEARAGRIFGLKRASLCFELADETIQYKE